MTATTTDRLDGLAPATAIKGPCKAASTTNLTLSGEQVVNGISIVADDRVLATRRTAADVERLDAELAPCGRAAWRSCPTARARRR